MQNVQIKTEENIRNVFILGRNGLRGRKALKNNIKIFKINTKSKWKSINA